MTAEASPGLDELIEAALTLRRRDLGLDELVELEKALRVPCSHPTIGCGAEPGHLCVATSGRNKGFPLRILPAHWTRMRAAGATYGPPTTEAERIGPRPRRHIDIPPQRDFTEPARPKE